MARDFRITFAAAFGALLLTGCGDDRAGNGAAETRPSAAPKPAPAPAAPQPPPLSHPWSPSGYALEGADPFWGGTLTGSSLRYMTPEDQFGDVVAVTAAFAGEREVYSGSYGGRPFVLTLTRSPCSNGPSDHRFAFSAALEVGGERRRGCADPL